MTEKEKTELKNFIIFLDLNYMNSKQELNVNGQSALLELDDENFFDNNYRLKLAKKIFDLIDKEK